MKSLRRIIGRRFPKAAATAQDMRQRAERVASSREKPELDLFRDIRVVPPRELYFKTMLADGGPIWPDLPPKAGYRHFRAGEAVDRLPEPVEGPYEPFDAPALWLGYAHPHFGHLVAEHTTRLPLSLYWRPTDTVMCVTAPGQGEEALKPYFWDVLAWFGVPRERVHVVTRPLMVRELRVAPQGEFLPARAPKPYYIDLMDEIAARQSLTPRKDGLVFVSRAGQLAQGRGANAGEAYLVDLLTRSGVTVIDPGTMPLRDQMEVYAGAQTLVFSEGSAMHGRQLLGRLPQRIVILQRRPNWFAGRGQLSVRCDSLDFAAVTARMVAPIRKNGTVNVACAISFYDPAKLVDALRQEGVDLAPHWSADAYAEACAADAAAWFGCVRNWGRIDVPETRAALGKAIAAQPDLAGIDPQDILA